MLEARAIWTSWLQVTRLEQMFTTQGEKAKGEKCKGMEGIIDEGSSLLDEIDDPDVRDAAIIASAQRVEHYEIAGYGTAHTFAPLLGEDQASKLLQQTLDEEKEADENLTALAEEVNLNATRGPSVTGENPEKPKKKRVA
jgi:ferritin-like metal-binding protein YciE